MVAVAKVKKESFLRVDFNANFQNYLKYLVEFEGEEVVIITRRLGIFEAELFRKAGRSGRTRYSKHFLSFLKLKSNFFLCIQIAMKNL
jgi:hypothetical protein